MAVGLLKIEKFSTKFGRFLSDGEGGFSDSEFFLSAAPLVIPSNFFPLADDVIWLPQGSPMGRDRIMSFNGVTRGEDESFLRPILTGYASSYVQPNADLSTCSETY